MFEIKKFLFQSPMYGFVTLLLMSSVLAASETLGANDSPITEKQEASDSQEAIVAEQVQTDTDRQVEKEHDEDPEAKVEQEDHEAEKQQIEYTDTEEEQEEDRELDDEFELEDALNEDRELGSDEYPIEDFDMDNINDREIGDFFDDQNNVDFRREGQIMKGFKD